MIYPVDPDDVDTLAHADTREEVIGRIRQIYKWQNLGPMPAIMIQRIGVPLWFARLVQDTPFSVLAYKEYRD